MRVGRLNWAGAIIETSDVRILIDPVFKGPSFSFFGYPKEAFMPLDDIKDVDVILITHLHSDHFDPTCIKQYFGHHVQMLVPYQEQLKVRDQGFQNVIGMDVGKNFDVKGIEIIATHSVDGLGDNQLSWIVRDGLQTIIHCGDTLWHGYWWKIAQKYGPFDIAFLPINGAIISEPGLTESNQPLCLNPEQAVSAAKILQAKYLIPIHFGAFDNPPHYRETEEVTKRLTMAAENHQVKVKWLKHHENFHIGAKLSQ